MSKERAEIVPKDWITAQQATKEGILRERGCTKQHAREFLVALVASGRAERKKFRIMCGEELRSVYHYRLKK
jgi:hypothetical protein